jgi:hypothetical protein
MRRMLILVAFLPLVFAPRLFAKADLSKVTIKGADLKAPIEITDPKTLANLNLWTGPGTSWSGGISPRDWVDTFIIDWSLGVTERPKGLQRYEVSFYTKLPTERLVYVVSYEYDPAMENGYVFLPGKTDEWYRLNVSTIFRGVEGRWFRAWSGWDRIARPLIANARVKS